MYFSMACILEEIKRFGSPFCTHAKMNFIVDTGRFDAAIAIIVSKKITQAETNNHRKWTDLFFI